MDNSLAYYCKTVGEFLQDASSGVCLKALLASIPKGEEKSRKSEIRSWENNIAEMSRLLFNAGLDDTFIAFEFFVPLTEKRIDCVLLGFDDSRHPHMVIIELKQWSNDRVQFAADGCNYAVDDEYEQLLTTVIAGESQISIHPCLQAKTYQDRVSTTLKAVINRDLTVSAFAYCYNFKNDENNILSDKRYNDVRKEIRLFFSEEADDLTNMLKDCIGNGMGNSCYDLLDGGYASPASFCTQAEQLLDSEGFLKAFGHNTDQGKAERGILASVRESINSGRKQVFIVNGGPGTGKTIVGMRLLCQFIRLNKTTRYSFEPMYMVRSIAIRKSFIEDALPNEFITRYISSGSYSPNFTRKSKDKLRVVLFDECHTICEEDNPANAVNSILDNFDIIVFLLDHHQCRAGQFATPRELILKVVEGRNDVTLHPDYTLNMQMRCDSSSDYIKWIDSVFYGDGTSDQQKIPYYFHICESAAELHGHIMARAEEGYTARICAGYCWPWHKTLKDKNTGTFFDDIVLGDFSMSWNTHKDILPPRGYVSKEKWACRPEGIRQVGCIYTTQGLEFDYIGVIVGPDIRIDEDGRLATNPGAHKPKPGTKREDNVDYDFLFNKSAENLKDTFIRNIYRVLLTRGMKGCYVYFCDPKLRAYIEERKPEFCC